MPRLCFLLALAVIFAASLFVGGESTLAWWQKAFYALGGGILALAVLRLMPDPAPAAPPKDGSAEQH